MDTNMTIISAEMYGKATSGELTIKAAAELLRDESYIRTLKDKILKFSKEEDPRKTIVNGLLENHPDSKKDAVERKVRGWFNERDRTIKKKDAIELAFILSLSAPEADEFVGLISGEGFHWRDPAEIGYIYALKKGISYKDATALNDKILSETADSSIAHADVTTKLVRDDIMKIDGTDELIEYIKSAKQKLGAYHNTAFTWFSKMYGLLASPNLNDMLPDVKKMTAQDIVEQYFYRGIISRIKQNGKENDIFTSAMQRSIKQNWPDEFTVSRILNKEIDVSRKSLILLFLATDGGNYSTVEDDDEDDFYEMSREDLFKETYTRLNTMLSDCGFSRIDPRSPFDWMVLYSMCVDELWEIDENMRDFVSEIYPDGN